MSVVHVVVPAGIDDPARPSGGNVYDRRVISGLTGLGWTVHEHTATATVPDGALTLVDGLLLTPELRDEAARLRLVVLVHLPRGTSVPWERDVLRAAAGVVTTSRWTRRRLLEWYDLVPSRVRVAEPGVEPSALTPGSASGSVLLCVGAVTFLKGYDVLSAALDGLGDLTWSCRGVGSTEVEPTFAAGLGGTIRLTGPLSRCELDATYAEADLLVLASRAETYGMVVTEALAHGVPVIVSDVGGVREAARRAAVLVPPGDAEALTDALRRWLTDADHRAALRAAARARRTALADWSLTTALVAGALEEAAS
ncbi:glycosyltransferase family 4 protein [Nocardioides sp. URHA0020]|uniref:glycosyltransferase family 4 protein n=1 Tax=Nocardioides sp. URHA0020 TaxID=1380392 RepID=UPI000491B9BF|nr:glycosyltransferase family 4 protein [Nocardioides sp. URHA0020]